MYGDEVLGLPASQIYDEDEASQAARWAELVYGRASETIAGSQAVE